MTDYKISDDEYGTARKLLRETGVAVTKQNHILFELGEWEAIDDEVAQLEAIVKLAHQWSAGYPLGGGMDEVAAKEIYERCTVLGDDK